VGLLSRKAMVCITVSQDAVHQESSGFLAAAFAVLATASNEGSLSSELAEGVGQDSCVLMRQQTALGLSVVVSC